MTGEANRWLGDSERTIGRVVPQVPSTQENGESSNRPWRTLWGVEWFAGSAGRTGGQQCRLEGSDANRRADKADGEALVQTEVMV